LHRLDLNQQLNDHFATKVPAYENPSKPIDWNDVLSQCLVAASSASAPMLNIQNRVGQEYMWLQIGILNVEMIRIYSPQKIPLQQSSGSFQLPWGVR